MRKKILTSVLLVSLIILPFIVEKGIINKTTCSNVATSGEGVYSESIGDPIGDSGVLAQITTTEFVLDGNLSDWESEGIKSAKLDNTDVYLAYDATYVYVGLKWYDSSLSNQIGLWNKTGMYDADDADWDFIDGEDDLTMLGFAPSDNISKGDFWIWTASNRTFDGYAYECDENFIPDAGFNSFRFNSNDSSVYYNAKPIYDNNWTPIVDYAAISNGALIDGWYNNGTGIPTDSQADVEMNWTYNENYYTLEFKRELDTTNSDDYVLDFESDELIFFLGNEESDHTKRVDNVYCYDYLITLTNEQAELTFDTLPSSVSESLLITGDVYDDFKYPDLLVTCSGWDYTYGVGAEDQVYINKATGEWSYLFIYNEYDMPLGTSNITVTLYPKYEDPIIIWQVVEFEDTRPPEIYGITDISDQYPDGIPLDMDTVYITIGIEDNYFTTSDLTVNLYYYKNLDVAEKVEMIAFSPTGRTFTCTIPVEHDKEVENSYTYFVQIYDGVLNKAVTDKYNFTAVAGVYTETQTGTENSHIVPVPIMEIVLGIAILTAISRKFSQRKIK